MVEQNRRPQYKEIKDYVLTELKKSTNGSASKQSPIALFESDRRIVIIKDNPKPYDIPSPKDLTAFQNAWIEVFLGCLNYLKQSLRKEGIEVIENENNITINGRVIPVDNYTDYATKLQLLLNECEKRNQNADIPRVVRQSIEIKVPNQEMDNQSTLKKRAEELVRENRERLKKEALEPSKKLKENVPQATQISVELQAPKETPISKVKLNQISLKGKHPIVSENITSNSVQDSKYDMHAEVEVKPTIPKSISNKPAQPEKIKTIPQSKKRKKTNYTKLKQLMKKSVGSKLDDGRPLSSSECDSFRENQITFVSGSTSNKGEALFVENMEVLQENIPDIVIAAFISGKVTTADKIASEVTKINRMMTTINSGVICYEANNDVLRSIEDEQQLLESIKAIRQIADVLSSDDYGYTLMICVDRDVKDLIDVTIKNISPNYQPKYPLLSRTSSRYLDDVADNTDLIIMHPDSDYDQVVLTDKTNRYVSDAINNNLRNQKISSKAA